MSREVGDFFDRHAEAYHGDAPALAADQHEAASAQLEANLAGEVLSVGGLWLRPVLGKIRVTVVDVSKQMLSHYQALGVETRLCDARALPFRDHSFDHVVYPLVLHHIVGQDGWSARHSVAEALREGARVLRTDGKLWVRDWVTPPLVYATELIAAPLTRRLMKLAGLPLVVMHSAAFFKQALAEAGLRNIELQVLRAPDERPMDWIHPVVGLPWLGLPRFAYPLRPVMITGQR